MSKDYYIQEPIKDTCLRVILYVKCLLIRFFYYHLKLLSFGHGVLIFLIIAYFTFRKQFLLFFLNYIYKYYVLVFFSVSLHVFVKQMTKTFFSHLTQMSQLTLQQPPCNTMQGMIMFI